MTEDDDATSDTIAARLPLPIFGERTWRISELGDMWAQSTGRNANEMLEQLVQDFLRGFFEQNGQPETIAESENERIASGHPVPISVDGLLQHMKVMKVEVLNRATVATLTIKDWERMGEHGRIALRLLGGLRLTQQAFQRWYQTAHLRQKPEIWPAVGGRHAPPVQPASEIDTTVGASADPAPRNVARISRTARTNRFRERQRHSLEWINFDAIADWCARANGDIKPDEERRSLAYTELQKALLEGDFEKEGRTRVIFLNPKSPMAKMTRERLTSIAGFHDAHVLRSQYLAHCWIPRAHSRIWFEVRRLPIPPWLGPNKHDAAIIPTQRKSHSQPQAPNAVRPLGTEKEVRYRDLPLWLTAMQAVAWVCTRNVNAMWRADLEHRYGAASDEPEGFTEEWFPSGQGITLLTLDAWHGCCHEDADWIIPSDPGRERLLKWLRAGDVRGIGTDAEGRRRPVDPGEWRDITLGSGTDSRELVPHRAPPRYGEDARWRDILIARDDLFRVCERRNEPHGDLGSSISTGSSNAATTTGALAEGQPDQRTGRHQSIGLVSDRTGEQGRPSSRHIVVAEFQRRVETGGLCSTLGAEARWLSDWLASNYPALAPMTRKTVENRIRDDFRVAKATK